MSGSRFNIQARKRKQHSQIEKTAEAPSITSKAIEAASPEPEKKRRRKKPSKTKRRENASWRRDYKPKRTDQENPSHLGTDTRDVLPGGEQVKTTFFVKGSIENAKNPSQHFSPKLDCKEVSTYTAAEKIVETSKTGTPIVLGTPGGSQLHRDFRLQISDGCSFSFYSNRNLPIDVPIYKSPSPLKLPANHNFFKSVSFEAIIPATAKTKEQTIIVTPALLANTRRSKQRNLGRRLGKSQNAVMARTGNSASSASASKYVEDAQLFGSSSERTKEQWLHLIAYSIAGESTQSASNLVAGSTEANVHMSMIEENMLCLSKHYSHFELRVKAELIDQTHIPKKSISYGVNTDDFRLNLQFNAHSRVKPHRDYKKYFHIFIVALLQETRRLEVSKKLDFDAPSTSGSTPSKNTP